MPDSAGEASQLKGAGNVGKITQVGHGVLVVGWIEVQTQESIRSGQSVRFGKTAEASQSATYDQ